MELNNKIVICQTADGQTSIDVKLENETVWLSQAQMAELFPLGTEPLLTKNRKKSDRLYINEPKSNNKSKAAHQSHVYGREQPVPDAILALASGLK